MEERTQILVSLTQIGDENTKLGVCLAQPQTNAPTAWKVLLKLEFDCWVSLDQSWVSLSLIKASCSI